MMNDLKALERQIQFQGLDYYKYKNFDFRKHGVTINYDFIKEILTNQYLTSQHFVFFMNLFSHYFDNKLVYLDPYMFSQDYMPELVTGFVLKNIGFQQKEEQKPQQIQNQQELLKSSDNLQNIDKVKPEFILLSSIQLQQPKQNNYQSQNLKQNQGQLSKTEITQSNTKGQKKEQYQNSSAKGGQNNDKKIQNQSQSDIYSKTYKQDSSSSVPQSVELKKPDLYNSTLLTQNEPQLQQKQQTVVSQVEQINQKKQVEDSQQIGQTKTEAEQITKIPEIYDNRYFQKKTQPDQSTTQIKNKQQLEEENQRRQQQQARSGKISKIFKELKSYYNFKQNPFQETGVSFIPINITNSHWICSIIFSDKKVIQYCDSLNNRDIRIEEGLLQLANHQGLEIDWQFFYDSPKQSNNYDCGVFCLRALYQVMRSKQPIQKNDYNQRDVSQFRKNLAKLSIITSQIDITSQLVIQILEQA